MAPGNVDTVRAIFAVWERGDFASVEWADPGIEYVIADGPSPGRWVGLAAMAEGEREFLGGWEGFRVAAEAYREVDEERVLVLVRPQGRGKASGLELGEIARQGAAVLHLRDGRVTRLVLYYSRERALADVGLEPERSSSQPATAKATPRPKNDQS